MRASIRVAGIVQGVGFRPFIYRLAQDYGLTGYVQNRGDAGVEIVAEGDDGKLAGFIADIDAKRPPLAEIYSIETRFGEGKGDFRSFSIKHSDAAGSGKGSVIPYDVAICDDCVRDMGDAANRRHDYFFTTCTNCGPRYTAITGLPYDRPLTTMSEFEMCGNCSREYLDPADRRYHAQTIACPKCGPQAFLADGSGKAAAMVGGKIAAYGDGSAVLALDGDNGSADAIRRAGQLLAQGKIVAIKGNGGFHLSCDASNCDAVELLRKRLGRMQQPFAVMAKNVDVLSGAVDIGADERDALLSRARPIVVLDKAKGERSGIIAQNVAPGLHNVGIMLPHTGSHILLFGGCADKCRAFVMTSANAPGEPMVVDNGEALEKLCGVADYFLFYDRRIAQRCDDSVVRLVGGRMAMLRRSRGYAPAPVVLPKASKSCVVAMGPELDVVSCILMGDKGFLSQHVGNTARYDTLLFLEDATRHLMMLTGAKPKCVACDLHPSFGTTRLARRLSDELDAPLFRVQHHHAHGGALMAEHGLDELVVIAADGYGYGTDGKAWGGEVLHCNSDGAFDRVAHLEEQPLVGGDLATVWPVRMAFGVLSKILSRQEAAEWIERNAHCLPHGMAEAHLLSGMAETKRLMGETTSCGRMLDAVSATLGVCARRTYEGEPAMKLESAARGGRYVLDLEPASSKVIPTTPLVAEIYEKSGSSMTADLSYSAEEYLASSLARSACEAANERGVKFVGASGGCFYNSHLMSAVRKTVADAGLSMVTHKAVPAGDGCVALGQAFVADRLLESRK
ncbi:MAG: carbamoyltransferase HypF [Thermoplasmata archaeon HGW-Thermoplasmata-1]|nr:MAG: carbamoyltransferase HypF [Thermoplasmata archaeon HGW-Thermoplasmata-1]